MAERPPAGFDPAIARYYDQAPEESRLEQGAFRLEAERTRELIERHMLPDLDDCWADLGRREVILHVARLLEAEPSVRGCSAHLLVVGRKGLQAA